MMHIASEMRFIREKNHTQIYRNKNKCSVKKIIRHVTHLAINHISDNGPIYRTLITQN